MSTFFQYEIRLSGMDVDGRGNCKASALLNHLQNAATLAAEDGGFPRQMMLERYGAFWMLARSWFQISRPLNYEDKITIRTWHRGAHGAIMYRDYDILVNGQPVGEAVSAWVLSSVNTRKLLRLGSIEELANTGGGELCKTMTLAKIQRPDGLRKVDQRLMRYSDTDINGHVNNIRYADFACDAIQLDKLPPNRFLAEMQIGYLMECHPGELIEIQAGGQGDSCFVCGLDESGKYRFESALFFGEVIP